MFFRDSQPLKGKKKSKFSAGLNEGSITELGLQNYSQFTNDLKAAGSLGDSFGEEDFGGMSLDGMSTSMASPVSSGSPNKKKLAPLSNIDKLSPSKVSTQQVNTHVPKRLFTKNGTQRFYDTMTSTIRHDKKTKGRKKSNKKHPSGDMDLSLLSSDEESIGSASQYNNNDDEDSIYSTISNSHTDADLDLSADMGNAAVATGLGSPDRFAQASMQECGSPQRHGLEETVPLWAGGVQEIKSSHDSQGYTDQSVMSSPEHGASQQLGSPHRKLMHMIHSSGHLPEGELEDADHVSDFPELAFTKPYRESFQTTRTGKAKIHTTTRGRQKQLRNRRSSSLSPSRSPSPTEYTNATSAAIVEEKEEFITNNTKSRRGSISRRNVSPIRPQRQSLRALEQMRKHALTLVEQPVAPSPSKQKSRSVQKSIMKKHRGREDIEMDMDQQAMISRLASIHDSLTDITQSGQGTRMQLLGEADLMIQRLPLKYLKSKPELAHYAYERCCKPVFRKMLGTIRHKLKWAFAKWKQPPPPTEYSEKQVGIIVISKLFTKILKPIYKKYLTHWMELYSSRYQLEAGIRKNFAATTIQQWYLHVRITKRKLFKFFVDAVQICLERRKAIKQLIAFESSRRNAYFKFTRAITRRRRHWFAARSLMRDWQWFKLYRKVQQRLTRRINVRVIQRWFRMTRYRTDKEKWLIHNILRHGGYSRVLSKMPEDLLRRSGFLLGYEQCACRIQRAWFVSKGNFAAFMIAAARRAKEEYEQMLNDNATVIQQNFRGHLWNMLEKAALQHNRARRISFAFRHYQYRVWVNKRVANRIYRPIRVIQRFIRHALWKILLVQRFKLRKVTKIWFNLKKTFAASAIQRAYRDHLERERIKLEEFKKWVAEQRKNAQRYAFNIRKIQRNWRQLLRKNRFPRHVYLVMWRIVRERRSKLFNAAYKIQKRAHIYIAAMRIIWAAQLRKAANTIWFNTKAYLLKLALFDRVHATRRSRTLASICIKKNLRVINFKRRLAMRIKLRIVLENYRAFENRAATYLERWMKRKWVEYYLPVRVAGRWNVAKKREAEIIRRKKAQEHKAACHIARFFAMFPVYNRNQVKIERERYRILRIYKARCIQKFARRVIAWARFDRIEAYRKSCIAAAKLLEVQHQAANIIGYYYKRRMEKYELSVRFRNRRFMIDEFNRLQDERKEAERLRDIAIEDKRRTDENMRATINASWKQGSDINGKNYYYNYVTGESSWEVPEGFKVPVAIDQWLRQLDDRGNVYYYNMKTQESAWLPPCAICGDGSEKYCQDCGVAYCDRCYDSKHELNGPETEDNKELRNHGWSLVEYEKDILKPGDIYCLECKRRTAVRMCLECWDAYCDVCFKYTHHTGSLKWHKTMAYRKVKLGWMTIKGTTADEPDYYVDGKTGVTQYEKPYELMTVSEKKLYEDFLSHQTAALSHVKKIEELQIQLEEASFERDSIMQDAMKAGYMGPSVQNALANKKAKKKAGIADQLEAASEDTLHEVEKANKPSAFDWLFGKNVEYRDSILKPSERARGSAKSDYIATLLEDIEKDNKIAKAAEAQAKAGKKF